MEKNIKMSYKNNEIEISAPTWNDKFELPDGTCFASDIQDYFENNFENAFFERAILKMYFYDGVILKIH